MPRRSPQPSKAALSKQAQEQDQGVEAQTLFCRLDRQPPRAKCEAQFRDWERLTHSQLPRPFGSQNLEPPGNTLAEPERTRLLEASAAGDGQDARPPCGIDCDTYRR